MRNDLSGETVLGVARSFRSSPFDGLPFQQMNLVLHPRAQEPRRVEESYRPPLNSNTRLLLNLSYQFGDIDRKCFVHPAGLRSDHGNGRDNPEHNLLRLAVV